ncbi:MAG: VOC family protein [SAR324 cluster bacterium]|nr:VOC family protein [SAR324 cluster bacterium]
MIASMNHISFTVSDLQRSIAFYRDGLGLKLLGTMDRDEAFSSKVTGVPGATLKIAFLGTTNCNVELIEYLTPQGRKADTATCNVGSAHVAFNVENFQEMIDRVLAAGGRMIGQPTLIPSGRHKHRQAVYLEDPDNNTIEFISVETAKLPEVRTDS